MVLLSERLANLIKAGGPPPDFAQEYVRIWRELHETRRWHAGGLPEPISYTEIDAYVALTRTPLEPHQVRIIRAMDRAWCEKAGTGSGASRSQTSGSAITPELFDAVFG